MFFCFFTLKSSLKENLDHQILQVKVCLSFTPTSSFMFAVLSKLDKDEASYRQKFSSNRWFCVSFLPAESLFPKWFSSCFEVFLFFVFFLELVTKERWHLSCNLKLLSGASFSHYISIFCTRCMATKTNWLPAGTLSNWDVWYIPLFLHSWGQKATLALTTE